MKSILDGPGRILVCTDCGETVRVLEAAQGAAHDEHEYLDPETYRCGLCATGDAEEAAA